MMHSLSAINAARSDDVTSRLATLRKTTGQVVGTTFFGTMLSNLRNSKLKGAFGHGGRGEEVFMAQLHNVLAERMGCVGGRSISDAIYKRMAPQVQRVSQFLSEELA